MITVSFVVKVCFILYVLAEEETKAPPRQSGLEVPKRPPVISSMGLRLHLIPQPWLNERGSP